jgi:hypothetical protein
MRLLFTRPNAGAGSKSVDHMARTYGWGDISAA